MKTIQDYLSTLNVGKDKLYKMALSIVACSLDANGWNTYEDGKEFITIKASNLEFINAILSDLVNNKEHEKIGKSPLKIQKDKNYLCISSFRHAGLLYESGHVYYAIDDNQLVNNGCWDYGKFDFSKLRELL